MSDYTELVKKLRSFAIIEDSDYENGGCAGYSMIMQAADAIEKLENALLLMVLQYCSEDGILYHSFMSAGEEAFRVLGLRNGGQTEPLWEQIMPAPPKEETE